MIANRIVIVEDEPLVRTLFLRTLAAAGFDVAGAADAVACRAILRKGPADLVMLDLGLPGVDGLTLARELRSQGDIGLIVVSREHAPEQRVAALGVWSRHLTVRI